MPTSTSLKSGKGKDLRNPVVYDTLKQLGVELRGLKFKPMPPPSGRPGERKTPDDCGSQKGFGRHLRGQTGRCRNHHPRLTFALTKRSKPNIYIVFDTYDILILCIGGAQMSDFHIGHLPIGGLKPNPRNARRHSQKQLSQIAASIRELGFNSLVVVDEDGVILVGHGRVEASPDGGLAVCTGSSGRPPHPRAKDCLRACRQQDCPQRRLGSRSAEGPLAGAGWGGNQLRSGSDGV